MEQAQPRDERPKIDFGKVYDFFLEAERQGTPLTTQNILEADVFPRSKRTINSYIRKRWRWFMHAQEGKRGRSYLYHLDGLLRKQYEGGEYPKEYFIAAHQPGHSQYFYQFAVAYQRYQEDIVKGRAKGRTLPDEEVQIAPPELNTDLPPEDEIGEDDEEMPEEEAQEEPEEAVRPEFITLSSDQRVATVHMEPSVKDLPESEVANQDETTVPSLPHETNFEELEPPLDPLTEPPEHQ